MSTPQWNGVRWVAQDHQLAELEVIGDLLQQVTDHVRDVFWLSDYPRRNLLYVSPAFPRIWGVAAEHAYRDIKVLAEAIHPNDKPEIAAAEPLMANGRYDVEYRVIQPDGNVRWVRDRAFPVRDERGEVFRLAGITQDISGRKDAEQRLQSREAFYRTLFEHTNDLVTVLDSEGRWLFQSRSVERVLGYATNELEGRPAIELVHPDDMLDVARMLKELNEAPNSVARAEYRLRRKDENYAFFDAVGVNLLRNPDVRAIVICARDVTSRRMRDSLTGLANETLLIHHLDLNRRRAGGGDCPFSLVMLGIDRFRMLNESLGEPGADRLLAKIAARLEEQAPQGVVARLSGDRFAVVLEGVTAVRHAVSRSQRLRTTLALPFEIMNKSIALTACTGLVVAPPASMSARDMLRAAESALAEAKRGGPDSDEVFDETDRETARNRVELEAALRNAIAEGEIIANYQPVVSLRTGRIAGFEALMRWQRPGVGVVSPSEFVPVAEDSRLICELDFALVRRAWLQLAAWREQYPHFSRLSLSVNLSARHFENAELVGRIDALLLQTGAPAKRLKIEITESTLMSNPQDATSIMGALKARGLQFGLDDFGTGYSSLSYLHQFPFRTLKIDQSFISTLGTREERPEMVRAIIGLARSLGLRTVAEGVETKPQLATVRELGCDYGQGFLIARPLTASEAERLLAVDPRW